VLIEFSKYSGCGNDFILIDNRSLMFPVDQAPLVRQLCDRHKGIGADGVVLLEESKQAHFKMRIFNSDGSEAEMCGNGIRCLLKFIHECEIPGNDFNIETSSKTLNVSLDQNYVAVEMGDPSQIQWNLDIESWKVHHLDTGVPHAIVFTDTLEDLNIKELGSQIRFHAHFSPRGANANFAQLDPHGIIHVRTYERGVEEETLACGTGATATALAAAHIYGLQAPLSVRVKSGDLLKIDFRPAKDGGFTDVRLIGSAKHIFKGVIEI